VRTSYRRRARSKPKTFRILDAAEPPDAVFACLERDLEALFG
jgi:hypothetical protein